MPASSSLAAPIVEKPTFGRGPDGRFPYGVPSYQQQITELKADTLKMTTMAQTASQRSASFRGYMSANTAFGQIDVVKQKEADFRLKEEESRAKDERVLLARAFKIEKGRFEAEWQARIDAVEAKCIEDERVLAEVHEIAHAANEKAIAEQLHRMRFKASSELLGMLDMEKKLARANEFKEAAEVATRCFKMRGHEENVFERKRSHAAVNPRQLCATHQATEMRNLVQKNHSLRNKVRREKEEAFAIFKQKYRNLEADQSHSHSIETHASMRPEIAPEVQAQKSRSTQSSTFRGTLKYESLAGTKFDVPDVSMLPDIPPEEMKLVR